MESNIINKLKKIKELVDRGEYHEAQTAKLHLEKILKKYDLVLSDLFNENISKRDFVYKSIGERKLISQILYKLFPDKNAYYYRNKRKVNIELSEIEYIEAKEMIDFYIPMMRKEFAKYKFDIIYNAFLAKHNIS